MAASLPQPALADTLGPLTDTMARTADELLAELV